MLSQAEQTVRPTGRRLTLVLVLLAVVALLITYVVTTRATTSPAEPPGRVLLDATFDDGRLDPAIWNTCHWWANESDGCTIASNDELEWYVPDQVTVTDGALRLTADQAPTQGSDGQSYDFRSGMVTTGPPAGEGNPPAKVAFTYGTVEARLRVPAGRGLWPAVWLLPASRESRPEIDLVEVLGQHPEELIMHLHPKSRQAESPSQRYQVRGSSLAEVWHTVRLDWSANRLEFYLDGVRVWKVKGAQVPDEPMYLVLNLAVGGEYPGPPDSDTRFPATFSVDYVRITTG